MIIFNSIQQLQNHLNSVRGQNKTIGFVPTMGALHMGHISLVTAARSGSDHVVCSIFVNPTQFNDPQDLEKYPRTLDADLPMLEKAGCDAVFVPEVSELYSAKELETKKQGLEDRSWTEGKTIDFGNLDKVMEGAHRPGHFNGVAQVVSKLFRAVKPDSAYFGQKDFQQLAIIRSMVKQLQMPIDIISCPILREPNGLAMSSRNERLSKQDREQAGIIYRTLSQVKDKAGTDSIAALKTFVQEQIGKQPGMQLEYFEISDAETLLPLVDPDKPKGVACIAVLLGGIRLIDNVLL